MCGHQDNNSNSNSRNRSRPGRRHHNLQPSDLHFPRNQYQNPTDNHNDTNSGGSSSSSSSNPSRELTQDSIAKVEELGNVHSASTWVRRDLGFAGQIGNYALLSYGDTLYTNKKNDDSQFRGMTSDSLAFATHSPLIVLDTDLNKDGYPNQACPVMADYGENTTEYALGITNVVETESESGPGPGPDPGHDQEEEKEKGIMYFLLNHRAGGINNIKGAGVASVTLTRTAGSDSISFPPQVKVNRLAKYWWDGDTEPWWGDVCALRWKDHIYAYGHAKDSPFVYVARVKCTEAATGPAAYQYWNGDEWQTKRPLTKAWGERQRVFWMVNQGQVIYSPYFDCFLFVYSDNFWNSKVQVVTASSPQGPFTTDPVLLYQATPITRGSTTYAAAPHPYFDPSGKTLLVTFTNHPNTIQAVRITFKQNHPTGGTTV